MIPEATRQKIREMLESGTPDAQAARDCDVAVPTVRRVRRIFSIPRKPYEPHAAEASRRRGEAVLLRKAGFTLKEIGEMMGGVTKQRVSQLLKGLDVVVLCAKCQQPTRTIHYFHNDNSVNGPAKGLCPHCAYGLQRQAKAGVLDETTKKFLQRAA